MSHLFRILSAACLAVPLYNRAGNAQPAPSSHTQVVFAAGSDGVVHTAGQRLLTPSVQVGVERRVAHSRFGLRLAIDYATRRLSSQATPIGILGSPGAGTLLGNRTSVYGAGLFGTYALATGRVQPYVLGSVGAAYSRLSQDVEHTTMDASGASQRVISSGWVSQRVPTVGGGFGVAGSVGRVGVFAEARYTLLVRGDPAIRRVSGPIVLGVRF